MYSHILNRLYQYTDKVCLYILTGNRFASRMSHNVKLVFIEPKLANSSKHRKCERNVKLTL